MGERLQVNLSDRPRYGCGVPFGLGTVVNKFGRMAAFQTAAARRIAYLVLGHYADDSAAVDSECGAQKAQLAMQDLARVLGVKLSDTKGRTAATMCDFLAICTISLESAQIAI